MIHMSDIFKRKKGQTPEENPGLDTSNISQPSESAAADSTDAEMTASGAEPAPAATPEAVEDAPLILSPKPEETKPEINVTDAPSPQPATEEDSVILSPQPEDTVEKTEDTTPGESSAAPQPPAREKKHHTFGQIVVAILDSFIPHVGDSVLEVMRKSIFVVALITLMGSLSYLGYDLIYMPARASDVNNKVASGYDPSNPASIPSGIEDDFFPEGMSDAFKKNYLDNPDIRGWIRYPSNLEKNFLENIDLNITRGIDNEYYLHHDFYRVPSDFGNLFFDMRNTIETPDDHNKITIVYGHNMRGNAMFAGLNQLLHKSQGLTNMRSAPVIYMDTIFEQAAYKVFAVMTVNTEEKDGPPFYYLHMGDEFATDEAFLSYIDEIRARSVYDFEDAVDVAADDDILILSTCTTNGSATGVHFDDGRLAVVARKVRPGESEEVDVSKIVKNKDVIMPLAWYVNQNLTAHPYYKDNGYEIPTRRPTTSTTIQPPQTDPPATDPTTEPTTVPPTTPPTTPPVTKPPTKPPTTPPATTEPTTKPPTTEPTTKPTTEPTTTEPTTAPPTTEPTTQPPTTPAPPPQTDPPASGAADPTEPAEPVQT